MVSLADLADDATLAVLVGHDTFARGAEYARSDRVREVEVATNLSGTVVQATVLGSGTAVYQTVVSVRGGSRVGEEIELYAACSCPVGRGCKHAVASVLVARDREGRVPAKASGPGWESTLAELLDDLDHDVPDTVDDPAVTLLGLQVELATGTPAAARHARWTGAVAETRGRLRVRPVSMGTRGRWVRSAVTWSSVAHADHAYGRFHQPQLDLLRELLVSLRAGSRFAYGTETADRDLLTFGPSLWRLLDRAREVGLPLVTAGALASVTAATGRASLQLDLTGTADGGTLLRAGAVLDGTWVHADDVDLMGDPAHGVVLWRRDDDGPRLTWSLVLAELDQRPSSAVQRFVSRRSTLEVPPDERGELLGEYVPRMRRLMPVASADGTVPVPVPVVPRLSLAVGWKSAHEVDLAWQWRYGHADSERVHELDSDPGRGSRDTRAERVLLADLRLEDAAVALLCTETAGPPRILAQQWLHGEDALLLGRDVLPALRASGQVEVHVTGDEPDYREARGVPEVKFTAMDADEDRPTDWFDLQVVVSVEGRAIGLGTLLEALTKGQRRIVLHDGVYVDVDRPELARLARLIEEAGELQDQPDGGVRVARHATTLWDELAELGVVDEQAQEWVRAAAALRDLQSLPAVAEPEGLHATLRPYQHEGFRWLAFLWETGLGGILADDMGLGKTVQTLALFAHSRATSDRPFLVVAPTSVVATWAGEAAKFTPGLTVRTVTESHARRGSSIRDVAEGADVVVTSYTLFRIEAEAYQDLDWAGLVLDEAQAVKNHQGKTYQAVRRLGARFTLAITGTPMENNLMELWSLLSIAAPGLYPHPGRFADHVAKPIERGHDLEALARLRRRVRPLMLRRTKDLVAADLPPKQEQVLDVVLSPRHRRLYDTHLQRERQKVLGLVEDLDQHRMAIFRSLTRLRQLSLDPALLDEAHDAIGSAKIDVLVDHLREVADGGHRALVFSQFTGFLARVRARLDAEGIDHAYLDGSTRDRPAVVQGFKDGDMPAFLISLKAGGVGLTLTEADYVFILDPWWNPAVEAQAVDRTHRIGQTRHVMVYRLVATATIEEKVMELKERKANLFTSVLDDEAMLSTPLSAADIAGLFSD
ncbi:MAG: DEAD/DEAH box helicase [Nocardioidaceae bacterium]|nr:DEAD/DEAH box helicase [Nocardioidaceae bacterium]